MRLIDADALKSATCVACGNGVVNGACCNGEDCTFIDIINEQLAIEPEVRRGRWIPNGKRSVFGDLEYLCSECRRKITVNWAVIDPAEYNAFCSGCGARMDATNTNVGGKGSADNG